MEVQRSESCLGMADYELTTYGDETTITYISLPICQVYTVNPMVFCVDPEHPSCIGDKAFERIVCHSGREFIPIIYYKRDFQFGDTLVR